MTNDPIIEEIYQIRGELLKRFDDDLMKLVEYYRTLEVKPSKQPDTDPALVSPHESKDAELSQR